jgi:hypothetical protein
MGKKSCGNHGAYGGDMEFVSWWYSTPLLHVQIITRTVLIQLRNCYLNTGRQAPHLPPPPQTTPPRHDSVSWRKGGSRLSMGRCDPCCFCFTTRDAEGRPGEYFLLLQKRSPLQGASDSTRTQRFHDVDASCVTARFIHENCLQGVGIHIRISPENAIFKRFSQNCEKRLLVSSWKSVHPNGTNRFQLDGFWLNFILECF